MEIPFFDASLSCGCCSDPTYEAWKFEESIEGKLKVIDVPILPMRHGNFNNPLPTALLKYCSDPTYEAWKYVLVYRNTTLLNSSDPTYEAWKLAISL